MFAYSYLQSAIKILREYNGDEPFSSFLKKYFAANKKFGSKDRKRIAHICYCYFRLGKWETDADNESKIKAGVFLSSNANNLLAEAIVPLWKEKLLLPVERKIDFLKKEVRFNWQQVFPWQDELSGEIDHQEFTQSFLIQPLLFLRVRPGKEITVKNKLKNNNIYFEEVNSDAIALDNATKIDDVLSVDKEVVIQDLNSQQTLDILFNALEIKKISVWDCCAASGGKSLLLFDKLKNVDLTVSDVRERILINLKKRFERAGVRNYKAFVQDVSLQNFTSSSKYDVVICDAPCSGSGTWSRTPEQLFFFDKNKIQHYSNLQKKIAVNTARAIKKEGFFVYITCSVFKNENEEVVKYIEENTGLKLQQMQYLKGYNKRADTLFTALFKL